MPQQHNLTLYATTELITQYATAVQLNTLSHCRTEHTICHSKQYTHQHMHLIKYNS